MKKTNINLLLVFICLTISSCQPVTTLQPQVATETVLSSPVSTETKQPTLIPTVTATFLPVSAKDLAGLIISSPILGTPQEHPYIQPPEMITPNGLGIINSEGELVKISGSGLFESYSPSGTKIVYQYGFVEEFSDYVDNLHVYNTSTGKNIEIFDDLEDEGGKTVISWLQDEQKLIYYNDFFTVLFEAYGYFRPKQLFLADVNTGQTNFLTEGYQFDVNPDGTQIAYTTGEILDSKTIQYGGSAQETFGCFHPHIYSLDTFTSQTFDISQLKGKVLCLGYPKWSPDGNYLAWIGYFENDVFRPIVFNLKDGTSTFYDVLEKKPRSSFSPIAWSFSESRIDPHWIDRFIFWTPSYEVNINTGEVSPPREIELPYYSRRSDFIKSPDDVLHVSLNEERNTILVNDINKNLINSFLLEDIYYGEKHEILLSSIYFVNKTLIEGWSPFAPPPNIGN